MYHTRLLLSVKRRDALSNAISVRDPTTLNTLLPLRLFLSHEKRREVGIYN